MPAPWRYKDVDAASDLNQGDILIPTDDLCDLFEQVHPHFCDPKYLGFVVITHSCDLVRRDGSCSARYINVAVIRSLSEALTTLLNASCQIVAEGCYIAEDKRQGQMLLQRVFNENEQNLGLFYLCPEKTPETTIGLGEDAVAFLRVNVAFRVDHYDVMREARRARVPAEFANKLGWLVGNLYSRVGTTDWDKTELNHRIEKLYLGRRTVDAPIWIKEGIVEKLREEGIDLAQLSPAELRKAAQRELPGPKETAMVQIRENVLKVFQEADPDMLERLRKLLLNDAALMATFRRR